MRLPPILSPVHIVLIQTLISIEMRWDKETGRDWKSLVKVYSTKELPKRKRSQNNKTKSRSKQCRPISQTHQQCNAAVLECCGLLFTEPRSHDGDAGNNLNTQTASNGSAEDLMSPAQF